MILQDGTGSSNKAKIDSNFRLSVSAESNERQFFISRDKGEAFNAIMPGFNATAGNYVFYIKNTSSSKNLFINTIHIASVQNSLWKVWRVTGTAAGGTTITPSNLNLTKTNTPSALILGGGATITGLTTSSQLKTYRVLGNTTVNLYPKSTLILGSQDAIVLSYATGTTGLCEVECVFHYE